MVLLLLLLLLGAAPTRGSVPTIQACDCKWPDLTANTLQTCDAAPKMCAYCMDALAYMFYGPENSPAVGCLVTGRSVDVCLTVARQVQVSGCQKDHSAVVVAGRALSLIHI